MKFYFDKERKIVPSYLFCYLSSNKNLCYFLSHFDEWYEVGWMEWEDRERRNEEEFIEFASMGVFANASKKFLQIKLLW